MSDGKDKDIVEEVFSRSKEGDDRVSALFSHLKSPEQVSVDKEAAGVREPKESPEVKDADASRDKVFQSANKTKYEFLAKGTVKSKKRIHRNMAVAGGGVVLLVLVFIAGSYLVGHGNDPVKTMQEKPSVNQSETAGVSGKDAVVNKNVPALDRQEVINWSRLLGEISAVIPKTIQLSVLESGDSSELVLQGKSLSTEAVYSFVEALKTNGQIKSAELTETGIEKWKSQDLLTFSISCGLVSEAAGGVDGDRFFTATAAGDFFESMPLISEQTGCVVKSLLVSPKDAVFEDKQTRGLVTRKHAVLTIAGGYQNILKAVEKLQNRSQGVWFDSISIKQGSKTEGLKCIMGISVYATEDTD